MLLGNVRADLSKLHPFPLVDDISALYSQSVQYCGATHMLISGYVYATTSDNGLTPFLKWRTKIPSLNKYFISAKISHWQILSCLFLAV